MGLFGRLKKNLRRKEDIYDKAHAAIFAAKTRDDIIKMSKWFLEDFLYTEDYKRLPPYDRSMLCRCVEIQLYCAQVQNYQEFTTELKNILK